MNKTKTKIPSNVDIANYNCLINKPKSEINLIDLMAISALEEKYPDLELGLSDNKV